MGSSITFIDKSELADGETIVAWAWDFGDGETSDEQNPPHVYEVPSPGTGQKYTVQLTIGLNTGEEKITQREAWVGNIIYNSGWNLVSVPVEAHNMLYWELFPDADYGTLYGFGTNYFSEEELEIGKGYWLRFGNNPETIIAGLVPKIAGRETALIELLDGWNFIGSLTENWDWNSNHFSDPQNIIIPGTLFGFTTTYSNASFLEVGKGYWVRTNAAGVISIHGLIAREGGELPGRYNDVEIDDGMVQELIDAGADLKRI
jgi:hypothetical protein